MTKFTGFTEAHVGETVTDIITMDIGRIIHFDCTNEYPIRVEFNRGRELYTPEGQYYNDDKFRRLYFGSNIKVEVTGEEVPESKLVCPVCVREHHINKINFNGVSSYCFCNVLNGCPFEESVFGEKEIAEQAMKNLIKAMNQ